MKLLDTRKVNLAEWLNARIRHGSYRKLDILTGFLYSRGWQAIEPQSSELKVQTISSVHVDMLTKTELIQNGNLPSKANLVHSTRFIDEITQHAKLFILSEGREGIENIAVIGSSNLTGPGLGLGGKKNLELNYIIMDRDGVDECMKKFNELWSDSLSSTEVKLIVDEVEDEAPAQTYFAQLVPGLLTYSEVISNLLFDRAAKYNDYSLAANEKYQLDAVDQIDFRLQRYGCCFLSDDVGLGKTIMGTGAIKRVIAREISRNPFDNGIVAAIICPKPVQSQWANHLARMLEELKAEIPINTSNLITRIQVVTYGQEGGKDWEDIATDLKKNVKILLIDEAHRLRNTTNFYNSIGDIDSSLRQAGSNPKYLFLTATPINNAFSDLYNLFRLALPASFWQFVGIHDIRGLLRDLDNGFSESQPGDKYENIGPLRLALGRLMIRRDVEYLRNEYGEEHLERLRIPKIEGVEEAIRAPCGKLAHHAGEISSFLKASMFYPYRLSVAYEEMNPSRLDELQTSVSSILRAHLSKSIQSSLSAGQTSLQNIILRCQEIIKTGQRTALGRLEQDFGQDTTDNQISDDEIGEQNPIDDAKLATFRDSAEKDLRHLETFREFLGSIQEECDSEKASALIGELDAEAPTLVFTEYRSTAKWLINHLLAKGVNVFPGSPDDLDSGQGNFQNELLRLDPSTDSRFFAESPNYSVYVLTDKYSEGRNFHKCRTIINYDLPWNPIRKTQRQGRIVRVGSIHSSVKIRSLIYSHNDLNEYADPEKVLREKLRKISAIFGKGTNGDILDEGMRFVSYFVRYNKASIGALAQSKADSLGTLEAANEGTYAYLIWEAIIKSGYISKATTLLEQWNALRVSRDRTFLLKGIPKAFFAIASPRDQSIDLSWYELKSGKARRANLEDIFGIETADLESIMRLEETVHHGENICSPDPATAQIIKDIRKMAKQAKVGIAILRDLAQLTKDFANEIPVEHFRSILSRLKTANGRSNESKTIVSEFIKELRSKVTTSDNVWVAICTEGYLDSRTKSPGMTG